MPFQFGSKVLALAMSVPASNPFPQPPCVMTRGCLALLSAAVYAQGSLTVLRHPALMLEPPMAPKWGLEVVGWGPEFLC